MVANIQKGQKSHKFFIKKQGRHLMMTTLFINLSKQLYINKYNKLVYRVNIFVIAYSSLF